MKKDFIYKVVCCLYFNKLNKLEIFVLSEILNLYHGDFIYLSTESRSKVEEIIGTSYHTFSNTLRSLETFGVIKRKGKRNHTTKYELVDKELQGVMDDGIMILRKDLETKEDE